MPVRKKNITACKKSTKARGQKASTKIPAGQAGKARTGKGRNRTKASKKSAVAVKNLPIQCKPITCPLTLIKVSACPNKECMWSNGNGGCIYRRNMMPEDLGSERGLKKDVVAMMIRKGKAEINRMLVLDAYISFVKEGITKESKTLFAKTLNEDAALTALIENSKHWRILQRHFCVDNFIMSLLCDDKVYSKFSANLGIKPPSVVTLTGLRDIYQERMRHRIMELKKTLRGKDKSKRRKAKGKSK